MRQISEDTPPLSAVKEGVSLCAIRPDRLRRRSTPSGSEALNGPDAAGAAVNQPVVQPIGASLPELDLLRNHAVAAPVRRARGLIAVAAPCFFHRAFKNLSRADCLALRRGPG